MYERRIPFRRARVLTRVLVCVVLVLLLGWGVLAIYQNWNGLPQLRVVGVMVGPKLWGLLGIGMGLGVLIGLIGSFLNLWRGLRPWPALVVSDEGVDSWVFGFVPWEDIERFEWEKHDTRILGPTVTLIVRNEDRVERQMTGWQRWLTNWNRRQGLPALFIPLRDVAIDLEELQDVLWEACPKDLHQRVSGLDG